VIRLDDYVKLKIIVFVYILLAPIVIAASLHLIFWFERVIGNDR